MAVFTEFSQGFDCRIPFQHLTMKPIFIMSWRNLSLVTRILQENAATISPGGEASGSWRGETVAGSPKMSQNVPKCPKHSMFNTWNKSCYPILGWKDYMGIFNGHPHFFLGETWLRRRPHSKNRQNRATISIFSWGAMGQN